MKIRNLKRYLLDFYEADSHNSNRTSILCLGKPGIGKSETAFVVGQTLAKDREFVDYDDDQAERILKNPEKFFVYVDFRLPECEPSDLGGIPRDYLGGIGFKPLLWARCLSKCAGVLVLDELTNVRREDIITAAYKLIFDRKAGFVKMHPDVYIIACGNKPERSRVARLLPSPLMDRVLKLDVIEPTVDDWMRYMQLKYRDEWDKTCYIFNKRFENEGYLLKLPEEPETLEAYPTPRSWTRLSRLRYFGMKDRETVEGLIGLEVGQKYLAFLEVSVDINDLIRYPNSWTALNLDGKYMASLLLATWISKHLKTKVISNCFRLIDEMTRDSEEFLVCTLVTLKLSILTKFLQKLFAYNTEYEDILDEIASIVEQIQKT